MTYENYKYLDPELRGLYGQIIDRLFLFPVQPDLAGLIDLFEAIGHPGLRWALREMMPSTED